MKTKILVTGATGKVGERFLHRLLGDEEFGEVTVRVLCHNRVVEASERVEVVRGSISEREVVRRAVDGVTHVVHLATCKETPEDVMDVAVKGLFWLLEECRASGSFRQFILIGGDAAVGHFVYPYEGPVTELVPPRPYPGCYAFSKVLEEVMLEQYYTQYDLNGCCLRAPWIMEKDDFKCQLSFGEDVFGGPRWCDLVGEELAKDYHARGVVPVMTGADGRPVQRNFVHVDDLVEAILLAIDEPKMRQQLVNVSMDEPVDYGLLAEYLAATRGLEGVEVETAYHSTWLDNTKAKQLLGWRPAYDLVSLVEAAWGYERGEGDPRKIWYPG